MKSSFSDEINKNGYLLYTSTGNSMMPLIKQKKDLLYIEKVTKPLKKYDIVLYRRDNGQYVLHRIIKVKNSEYIMCGDNQCVKEYGITDKHIVGVLSKIIKDGKAIKMNNKIYLIYSHLWVDFFHIRALLVYFKNFINR